MPEKKLINSFNCAVEGLVYVIKTERHMRYHLMIVATALVFVLFSRPAFDIPELILLFLTMTSVLVAEMINTAVEVVVDMVSPHYSSMAKIAKDVAAGGVLLTCINSVIVAYLLFFSRFKTMGPILFSQIQNAAEYILLVGLLLTIILVIGAKAATRSGTPMQGGVISGHSAVSVFLAVAIFIFSNGESMLISVASSFLALLVIQSRLETGVHTPLEVLRGALVGLVMALALFKLII